MVSASDSEKIGRLLEAVERLTEEVLDERIVARDNRAIIHRRLDGQGDEISRLRQDVAIMGKVDAQVRDELAELRETVTSNHNSVLPDIDEWRRMRRLGRGLFWLLGLGGVSLGAAIVWAGEAVRTAVLSWLKIG